MQLQASVDWSLWGYGTNFPTGCFAHSSACSCSYRVGRCSRLIYGDRIFMSVNSVWRVRLEVLQPKATSLYETWSNSQARWTCTPKERKCSCVRSPWTHTREWVRQLKERLAHDSNHKAAASDTQDHNFYPSATILCRLHPSIKAIKYLYWHSLWIELHHFGRSTYRVYIPQESCRICDMLTRAKISNLHASSRAPWRYNLSKRAF